MGKTKGENARETARRYWECLRRNKQYQRDYKELGPKLNRLYVLWRGIESGHIPPTARCHKGVYTFWEKHNPELNTSTLSNTDRKTLSDAHDVIMDAQIRWGTLEINPDKSFNRLTPKEKKIILGVFKEFKELRIPEKLLWKELRAELKNLIYAQGYLPPKPRPNRSGSARFTFIPTRRSAVKNRLSMWNAE